MTVSGLRSVLFKLNAANWLGKTSVRSDLSCYLPANLYLFSQGGANDSYSTYGRSRFYRY
jgi:hypothetical protein